MCQYTFKIANLLNMKTILRNLLISLSLPILFAGTASAATTNPEEILKNDTDVLIKLDPNKLNSTLKGHYATLIESTLTSPASYYVDYEPDYNPYTTEEMEVFDTYYSFLQEKISNNEVVIGITSRAEETEAEYDPYSYEYNSPYVYVLIPATEEEFENNIVKPILTYRSLGDTEDYYYDYYEDYSEESFSTIVNGTRIYKASFDYSAVTYFEGYLIMAQEMDDIGTLLESENNSITTSESMNAIKSKISQNQAFEMYMTNFDWILDELGFIANELPYFNNLSNFSGLGLSLGQTETGFKLESYLGKKSTASNPVASKLELLGKLSVGENIIYFSDSVTLKEDVESVKENYEYEDLRAELLVEADIDIDDLLKAFEKEIAILVENTNKFYPQVYILSKLGGDTAGFSQDLDMLQNNLWESLSEDASSISENSLTFADEDFITTVNKEKSGDLTTYRIVTEYQEKEDPFAVSLPPELTEITINVGIVDDVFVMTNGDYDSSITTGVNNDEIKSLITSDVNSISYFDFQQLKNYLINFANTLQSLDPQSFNDLENFKTLMDKIFTPMGTITSTGTVTSAYTFSSININLDLDTLINFFSSDEYLDLAYEVSDTGSLEMAVAPREDFEDVKKEDWYAEDVYYLRNEEIINGYYEYADYDGNYSYVYQPEQGITRAEFLKLATEALQDAGYLEIDYYDYYSVESQFSDVDIYAWYAPYANTAISEGFAKGYIDGTFRGDNYINRAEAATILAKIIEKYGLESDNESADSAQIFKDVDSDDWFVPSINTTYRYEIMQGLNSSEFGPKQNLNRAQSARIIKNLIEVLNS